MTRTEYIRRKTGNRSTEWKRIVYMTRQSFTAPTFRAFWQNWNPLWSYYLTFRVYAPLRKQLPEWLALLLTFAISGFLHDVAAMIVLGRPYFLFTLLFSIFGLCVLAEALLGISFRKKPTWMRVIYHLTLLVGFTWGVKTWYR
jgi:hypothetical protein